MRRAGFANIFKLAMFTFWINPLLFEDHVNDNAFVGLLHGGIMLTTVIDYSMYFITI